MAAHCRHRSGHALGTRPDSGSPGCLVSPGRMSPLSGSGTRAARAPGPRELQQGRRSGSGRVVLWSGVNKHVGGTEAAGGERRPARADPSSQIGVLSPTSCGPGGRPLCSPAMESTPLSFSSRMLQANSRVLREDVLGLKLLDAACEGGGASWRRGLTHGPSGPRRPLPRHLLRPPPYPEQRIA